MLKTGRTAFFAEPAMSSDNAVGIAALALSHYFQLVKNNYNFTVIRITII